MRKRALLMSWLAVLFVASCAGTDVAAPSAVAAERPFVNLASKAKITATSEHKKQKLYAQNVADGRFAPKGVQGDEFVPANKPAKSWAVDGEAIKDKDGKKKATITFVWKTPVTASQIIYYPRMAFQEGESWKDYEVYANDGPKPIAKGSFPKAYKGHRIRIPETRLKKLSMKFLNSHGGWNPGATEILITNRDLSDDELEEIAPTQAPRVRPWKGFDKQNVVWKSPSNDESGAMPIGNGSVLANVWVEPNGTLRLNLGKMDAKTGKVTRLGRVRVTLRPALPTGKTFRQTLQFGKGAVQVLSGHPKRDPGFLIFVDANRPVVHVQLTGRKAVGMRASYGGLKGADLTAMNNRVRYRRGGVAAVMVADTMVGWGRAPTLKLEKPAASVDLQIHVVAADGEKWAEQANGAVDANRKVKLPQAIQQHQKKWREFWQNQSIFIGGTRGSKTVPAALVHTQWLSKCSGRGSYAFKPKPAAKDGARKGVARWPAAKIKQKMAEVLDEAAAGLGTGSRFAGTWGPYFANLPKAGAVQSLFDAVRDMVVEEHGGKIYLFPGWPGGRDVSFRLALSGNRRIEAVYAKGKFDEIEVWPKRQTGSVVGLGKFAKTTRRALAGRFRMPALISFISPSHGASGGMEPLAVTMKDAGFNGYEGNVSNLEWCKKHGFYLLMHGVNEWTAARLKDDKTVISYYMSDRRKTNWFPIFGNIRKHYEAIDPNHPTEFTMYVRYGGFEYFVDAVRPHLLEYYDYHWTRGHHLQAAYLEIYRARSIEAGGIPIFRYCHVHGDPPTKMRQTVTMSLAYGVKGFKWWVGWCMFDIHNIKKGVPPPLSPIGQEAKNIGASLKAFSPYLATAQSLQVYNTKPQPGGTRAAPKDYWVVPSGDHVVMGVFRNDDYEKYRYLVVGNRDIGSARTVTLTFQTKMLKIAKMNKKTRKWVKVPIKKTAKGQTVRVKLEHGGVELICVEPVKKWDE